MDFTDVPWWVQAGYVAAAIVFFGGLASCVGMLVCVWRMSQIERAAHAKGREARKDGLSERVNPYHHNMTLRQEWFAGWHGA